MDMIPQDHPELDPNDILVAEFQYIAQTAFQANEDRARVSSYYLVTAGAAVAAIVGAKIEGATSTGIYLGFSALFAVLSGIGWLTLLQLARLLTAWTESARAMNLIKEYYIAKCPEKDFAQAFAWRLASIPPPGKHKSLAFLLALSVILIDTVTAAAVVIYAILASGSSSSNGMNLILGVVAGLVFAVIQYSWYNRWLR